MGVENYKWMLEMMSDVTYSRPGEGDLMECFSGERKQTWLWHFLNGQYGAWQIGNPDSKMEMGAFIDANPHVLQEARQAAKGGFIHDDEFKWLNNSLVQRFFLERHLRKSPIGELPWLYSTVSGRRWFVALIDCLPGNLDRKVEIVRNARRAWGGHAEQLRVFNWFKGKEESAKCEFAWHRFIRLGSEVVNGQPPFRKQEDVILAFEVSSLGDPEKEILIQKLKRAWTQDCYRKSLKEKSQSQFNVTLSDEAIAQLGELRTVMKMSRTKILEELIRREWVSCRVAATQGYTSQGF